jgi:hypothetical protein
VACFQKENKEKEKQKTFGLFFQGNLLGIISKSCCSSLSAEASPERPLYEITPYTIPPRSSDVEKYMGIKVF